MEFYGYVRVSTKEQNEDRQLLALKDYQIPEDNIFIDKSSGKDFDRPEYQRMLSILQAGDVVVVESIDRLGRNYEEILEQWKMLNKTKGIDIVVLDMPLLDTRKNLDLVGTVITDIVLQLLSYVAQTEREKIKQRQADGIVAAQQKGIKFGKPKKVKPQKFATAYRKVEEGKKTPEQIMKELHISRSTYFRYKKKLEQEPQSKA